MGTSTNLDVEVFFEIQEAFKDPITCEHSQHSDPKHSASHDTGDAEWYIDALCTNCEQSSGIYACCDRWKKVISEAVDISCNDCMAQAPIKLTTCVRIDK